jgi:hypothetical protein
MRSSFQRSTSKIVPVLVGATLLCGFGPPALRAIEQVDFVLAQISLHLCHVGLAIWRACGM